MTVTAKVSKDEPAHWLLERNLTPMEASAHGCPLVTSRVGTRRYRIITVYRDDGLADYWEDMGVSEEHPYPPVQFPAYGEWRVGDLLSFADIFRGKHDWELQILADAEGESTIAQRYQDFEEVKDSILRNRSLFGRLYKQARNGFARSR